MIALILFTLAATVTAENVTESEITCEVEPWEASPWEKAIEEWATSPATNSSRQGRVLNLPPANGYYVTDRIDANILTPPPSIPTPRPYEEWHPPPDPGKVVNRPSFYPKDKFKPSYPPPQPPTNQQQSQQHSQQHPQQHPQQYPARPIDRIDSPPPQKQVSETDLVLLSAIEKLTYRLDLMEKRLRKMEESMHLLVAGSDPKPEPCISNFTRVSGLCYHFSSEPADWKTANLACRKLRANLLELDANKKRQLTAALQTDIQLKDKDWWTGGLNPGLLWIWSHSARPIAGNDTNTSEVTIIGEGRCLSLVYDPAVRSHAYRGHDCALRHRYVCEKEEDKTKLGNEIERVARKLRSESVNVGRKAKLLWSQK